jgi:Tfp pilus assembly protein PilF
MRLLKARQYREAIVLGQKCLALEPLNADCQLVVATAHSSLEEPEQAAPYYRKFLMLAPDHKLAPNVRQLLDLYERSKTSRPVSSSGRSAH